MDRASYPRRRDVDSVGLPVLDNFRVAACNGHAGLPRGIGHGPNFCLKNRVGKPSLENIGTHKRLSSCAGDSQIIHRPVYRKLADGTSGKAQGLDDETVGCDCDLRAVDLNMSGISQRLGGCGEKQRSKETFDEPTAGLTPCPVCHLDLGLTKANRRRSFRLRVSHQAVGVRMFTISVFRCS